VEIYAHYKNNDLLRDKLEGELCIGFGIVGAVSLGADSGDGNLLLPSSKDKKCLCRNLRIGDAVVIAEEICS